MRGLDDALDRLARRDQLRRRAAGESPGTPPAVTELVEAIAAVVGRHPELAVTVGVEGMGDPTLLHFAVEDGIVQVSADNSVGRRVPDPGHDDVIDVDLEDPHTPPHGYVFHQADAHPAYAEPAQPQPQPFAATPPPPVPPQEDAWGAPQRGMPEPLPEPIPLQVDEQETEMAARRIAALLRADPSLLRAQD